MLSEMRTTWIFTLLLLLALLSRFPFFFHDVINWDESTFILVGQAILDGHLPYLTLYELKPPLLFGFFAAVILIGGKSIVAIRVAGMLCVWIVGCFIYAIARRLWNGRAGFIAAFLYVIASAIIAHTVGQATMSETVAVVPLAASLLLLLRPQRSTALLFFAGVLIATAALIRSNLVFVAFGVGVWLLVTYAKRPILEVAHRVLTYCAGGLLVVLLAFVPYGVSHNGRAFWDAVFIAPIIYSSTQMGPLAVAAIQIKNALGIFAGQKFPDSENILGLTVWIPAAVGLLLAFTTWGRRHAAEGGQGQWLAGTYAVTVGLSIVFGGVWYAHYLIQLLPFACIYAASVYLRLADYPIQQRLSCALIVLLLAFALLPVARQYKVIITRLRAGESLVYGTSYDIANLLRPRCVNGCSLYLLTNQLAYWFLNVTPPTRLAVHPADVVMKYAIMAADGPTATPESEVRQILQTAPDYIVKPDVIWYLGPSPALEALESTVSAQYKMVATTADLKIYQRVAPRGE